MVKQSDTVMSAQQPQHSKDGFQEHVKRPMNAFMVWAKTERRRLALTLPGMPNSEVSKILGGLWKRLPDEEKSKYRLESESIRKQHRSEHPEYRYHPRRRVMKGAGKGSTSKTQKFTGLPYSRPDAERGAHEPVVQSLDGYQAQGLYSQQQPMPFGQCMFRQAPEAYLSWATTSTPLTQNNFSAAAPAGFYPAFVTGHSIARPAPRPATITFNGPTRPGVEVASSTADGQCGWPTRAADSALDRWSRGAGAMQAAAWSSGSAAAVAGGDCSSEVGTPPALMHATLGESPQSTACNTVCSPDSPLNGVGSPQSIASLSTQPQSFSVSERGAHAQGQHSVVPSADDIVGYMKLYLGESEREAITKETLQNTETPKLGHYLPADECQHSHRSSSPPFAVPQVSSRQIPSDNSSQLYDYQTLGACSTAGQLSTPSPSLSSTQCPGRSSHWAQTTIDSPITSQMTSPAVVSSVSFANSSHLQQTSPFTPIASLASALSLPDSWSSQ